MERSRCTPEQMAVCPLRRHFTDWHHRYWPRREYRDPVEQEFRDLDENGVRLCRNEHNIIHETQEPPEKPTREEMIQAIARTVLQEA